MNAAGQQYRIALVAAVRQLALNSSRSWVFEQTQLVSSCLQKVPKPSSLQPGLHGSPPPAPPSDMPPAPPSNMPPAPLSVMAAAPPFAGGPPAAAPPVAPPAFGSPLGCPFGPAPPVSWPPMPAADGKPPPALPAEPPDAVVCGPRCAFPHAAALPNPITNAKSREPELAIPLKSIFHGGVPGTTPPPSIGQLTESPSRVIRR